MTDNLIFGYKWEDIQQAQQGEALSKIVPLAAAMAKDDICTEKDLELVETIGIAGIKEKGFFGVLDRLQRAGIIES